MQYVSATAGIVAGRWVIHDDGTIFEVKRTTRNICNISNQSIYARSVNNATHNKSAIESACDRNEVHIYVFWRKPHLPLTGWRLVARKCLL